MSGKGRRRQRSITTEALRSCPGGYGMSGKGRRRQRTITTEALTTEALRACSVESA
ncbi:hypothetical protein NRB56_27960 [Nocardia sp. RB56]|uniref:Uncharacterized protein n=1 Tax=Nocardia aurantia TaxID=2585199 RepID=A0A7K0DQX7_9NOCA|nr:hypothetical protein [Nocardia aurantia]